MDKINHAEFAKAFLTEYLADGFANMPKREIDLLVLRLLIDHSVEWSWDNLPSAFNFAKELRAKKGRLRSMLDELSFRNALSDEDARERLRHLLEAGEKDLDGNKVRIQIEDGYLREYAKSLVQADFGLVDTSFDRSIVTLSGDKFLFLVSEIMSEEAREEFQKQLVAHREKLGGATNKEGLLKTFLREFVKSASKEAGKKSIQLGFAALTGGISAIGDLIDRIFAADLNDNP